MAWLGLSFTPQFQTDPLPKRPTASEDRQKDYAIVNFNHCCVGVDGKNRRTQFQYINRNGTKADHY
jgi:hypothetical protein